MRKKPPKPPTGDGVRRPRRGALQAPAGQSGLTMVELLVAMAVGLFLLAGIIQMLVSSKAANRFGEAESRVQENGRYAIQALATDLRGARGLGCRSAALEEAQGTLKVVACDLLDSEGKTGCAGVSALGAGTPLGYAASQKGTPAWLAGLPGNETEGAQVKVASQWLRGDVLIAWGVTGDPVYAGPRTPAQDADLESPVVLETTHPDLAGGRLALITDCEYTDIFTITSPAKCHGGDLDPPEELAHQTHYDPDGSSEECDAGGAGGQVNASASLSRAYNRQGDATSPGTTLRARVFPFHYSVHYLCCVDSKEGTIQERSAVGKCGTQPTRYRPGLCRWSTRTNPPVQQLVSDVADLRLTFDGSIGPPGGQRFLDRGVVTDAAWVSGQGYWDRVDSVRVQLLATTGEEVRAEASSPNPEALVPTDLGSGLPKDRRIYQILDVTTALRASAPWYVAQ